MVNADATRRPFGDILVRLEVDGRSSANKRVLAEVSTTVRVDAATNAAREEEDASSFSVSESSGSAAIISRRLSSSPLGGGVKKSKLLNRP